MKNVEKFPELSVREKRVLFYTIHRYIADNDPVGSRTISKAFDFDMSAATVRNICADLEESGYLDQPHTSAGRRPTDKGYRYYLNELVKIQSLAVRERERIVREYQERMVTVDEILQKTAKLLSAVSDHTSVVVYPDHAHVEISRMSLMLDNTDFKDVNKLREAMRILEEPQNIEEIFKPSPGDMVEVNVRLGQELKRPALDNIGIITADYVIDDHTKGALGIVGPKRMPYDRLIALVRTIQTAVNTSFRRLTGRP